MATGGELLVSLGVADCELVKFHPPGRGNFGFQIFNAI